MLLLPFRPSLRHPPVWMFKCTWMETLSDVLSLYQFTHKMGAWSLPREESPTQTQLLPQSPRRAHTIALGGSSTPPVVHEPAISFIEREPAPAIHPLRVTPPPLPACMNMCPLHHLSYVNPLHHLHRLLYANQLHFSLLESTPPPAPLEK
jgi:hypothetical protein